MTAIQQLLFDLQDPVYRVFQSKLIPTLPLEAVIGVRTPQLRALAKTLAGSDEAKRFMQALPHTYYEENTLHGCLIERIGSFEETVAALTRFLPFVDNWATCDMLRPRIFARHHAALLPFIQQWLCSPHTYTVRYGIGMLMAHFLDEDFQPDYPEAIAAIQSEEYYIQMMAAWYFATALAKQPDAILPYFTDRRLSPTVHRLAVQKARESRRITPEQKALLRDLQQQLQQKKQ